jgi:ArsR family transcriptional regulator, arsenate/arsenite/antimonite-responsive transcriptional repressor
VNKAVAELNLEARAQLFKALSHPTRLLIISLVRMQPRHTEELASILKLSAGTVSHHLSMLSEVGLLESQKEQYYQNYALRTEWLDKTLDELTNLAAPSKHQPLEPDAYRNKVIKTFFKQGRLVKIPAQRKKLLVVLEELVKIFEPEKTYSERDVSILLSEFHDDFATLRRDLVDFGLMHREGGIYRRTFE